MAVERLKGGRMNRFDRLMEDWIIPLLVIGAIVTLALLTQGKVKRKFPIRKGRR